MLLWMVAAAFVEFKREALLLPIRMFTGELANELHDAWPCSLSRPTAEMRRFFDAAAAVLRAGRQTPAADVDCCQSLQAAAPDIAIPMVRLGL
jgi:hypothetical protein